MSTAVDWPVRWTQTVSPGAPRSPANGATKWSRCRLWGYGRWEPPVWGQTHHHALCPRHLLYGCRRGNHQFCHLLHSQGRLPVSIPSEACEQCEVIVWLWFKTWVGCWSRHFCPKSVYVKMFTITKVILVALMLPTPLTLSLSSSRTLHCGVPCNIRLM